MTGLPVFDGVVYPTQLHARWAVFFKTAGIPFAWREGGRWGMQHGAVPDHFWLRFHGHVIVLNDDPVLTGCRDWSVAAELTEFSRLPTYVFAGLMEARWNEGDECRGLDAAAFLPVFDDDNRCIAQEDGPYRWCQCSDCGVVGMAFEGRTDRLPCKECTACGRVRLGDLPECPQHDGVHSGGCPRSPHLDKGRRACSPNLYRAYATAAAANFELTTAARWSA